MKILIDMNLSPAWAATLVRGGHEAVHWSAVGAPNAPDSEILKWARENGHIVFTHDLDFGASLAATRVGGPSIIQARTDDPHPPQIPGSFAVLGPTALRVRRSL